MPPSHPLPCPGCRYDLATLAGDQGTCPECGREFSKAAIAHRSGALLHAALGLTGFAAAAFVLAGAAGACIAYLPRAQSDVFLDPESAVRSLRLAPALLLAAGIGVLGVLTGRTPWQRRWPAVIASVFAASRVYAVVSTIATDPAYSPWLQPHAWGSLSRAWLHGAASGLVILAACACLLRQDQRAQTGAFRRTVQLLFLAGAALALFSLLSTWHSGFVLRVTGYRPVNTFTIRTPGSTPPPTTPYFRSWVLNDVLVFFTRFFEWVSWTGLAALSLLARAVCPKDTRPG